MARKVNLLVLPVTNIAKAKEFYSRFLGTEPYADSPYYVGFKVGELEVGLDPNSTAGPIGYVDVEDIKSSVEEMAKAGAEIVQDVRDVAAGLLVAQLKDADGNVVGLRQQT